MKILATTLLFIALLLPSTTFARSVDYCVTTYADGTQECGPHAKGLGIDCTSAFKQASRVEKNGKRVTDVRIVSKAECNRINNNTSGQENSSEVSQRKSCKDIYWDLWDSCFKKCGVGSGRFNEGSREYSCVDSCFARNGCEL